MLTWRDLLVYAILSLVVFGSIHSLERVYQQRLETALVEKEKHPLCKDTATKTAYVAYRDGVPRCFLEHNTYPHRASGSNIDENT